MHFYNASNLISFSYIYQYTILDDINFMLKLIFFKG